MALYVYDHGYRIQTPKQSLFKPKGVDTLNRSRHGHRGADIEDQVHADGEKSPLTNAQPQSSTEPQDTASKAYTQFSENQQNENGAALLTVDKIMVSPVHTITDSSSIIAAWKRMQDLEVSHLIVSNDGETPLGLLSKNNLMKVKNDSVDSITDIFSKQLIAATPETRVQDVAITFIEHEINAMPVVDTNDKILGMVCRTDLLRLLISGPHLERWV